ncbi:MAG: peptidoglycan editing factor PgeF [Alphaproteobacteria bacterium]|nr:peptidoglycan editing factor PgeF [Alphaproteobacteria bacterium]
MSLAPYSDETLARTPGIRHGFFSRTGGVSEGIYAGLNCGLGSDDDRAHVHENRSRVARAMGIAPDGLRTLYQVHSARVVDADTPWDGTPPEADALVCTRPGVAIGALAADCAPVLLADADAGVIGAAHAGWRGARDGVVAAVVEAMCERGADRTRIVAAVGPCIGPESYEVGPEFPDHFLEQDDDNSKFFREKSGSDRYLFDLPAYVLSRLNLAGVSRASATGQDTYRQDDLFSYRRSCHRMEPDYGRNLSVITLVGDA